jgi:AcrR family transcriptional regulator
MNTKERLIETAVRQFNARGVHGVSIRDIAHEVGISSGNFTYYFKNKQRLIEHFYHNMYTEVTIDTSFTDDQGFERFNEMLKEVLIFMNKYRFFYTDIVEIFRMCPEIKKDYAKKYPARKEIYTSILKHFVARDLLKPSTKFQDISHIIWFTMTFWQSQKLVISPSSPELQPDFILKQIWQLIIPTMTALGLRKFHKINIG